jgi:hypothetical protein
LSTSSGLRWEETDDILQPTNENLTICDLGSELDGDDDSVTVEKILGNSESQEEF